MYAFVSDESEGVMFVRITAGSSSADNVARAMTAITQLDRLDYRGPHPRVMLVLFEDRAEHFGPADRERIIEANVAVRHRTVRLLVANSTLHLAALAVMKQSMTPTSRSERTAFGTLDEALLEGERKRPGLGRVIARLRPQLQPPAESGVVRSAAIVPGSRRQTG